MYLSINLSVCRFIYLSIYLFIHLSINLSIYVSVYVCTYLSTYLSIYFSIYLSVNTSMYASFNTFLLNLLILFMTPFPLIFVSIFSYHGWQPLWQYFYSLSSHWGMGLFMDLRPLNSVLLPFFLQLSFLLSIFLWLLLFLIVFLSFLTSFSFFPTFFFLILSYPFNQYLTCHYSLSPLRCSALVLFSFHYTSTPKSLRLCFGSFFAWLI